MKIVNIGIVAHVDAGKTSLTERILFETGVIPKIGRVDHGNTLTDSLALERSRGITIKASVVSFSFQDLKINLIDTPGHADFVAEVERAFSVLDGVILVISAVEGIQAQTKLLMSILKQLALPTIIFVNKIDRMGAQSQALVSRIKAQLSPSVMPLCTTENIGTKQASIVERSFGRPADQGFLEEAIDLLSRNDEQLLEAYINDEEMTESQLVDSLAAQANAAKVYPLFFGSAMTGAGVTELLSAIGTFFPLSSTAADAMLSAMVFKIEREVSGEKIAYARVFSGTIRVRDDVPVLRKGQGDKTKANVGKVKKLNLFQAGQEVQAAAVSAGDFCKVWGLSEIKIGDVIGEWSDMIRVLNFVTPQMETHIEAIQSEKSHQLFRAMIELSEEDPLVKVIKDSFHNELYLRIFGEVQKEVLEATLQDRYDVEVRFLETRVVCVERPEGIGQAHDMMGGPGNPFVATVGFRVEPGKPGNGITYALDVHLGSLPLPLHRAIEGTIFETLRQGLYGWEVTDIAVTLTHSGYSSVGSTAGDFRNLVPLVLMDALVQAGTAVYEPLNEFELSAPLTAISEAMYRLTTATADFDRPIMHDDTFLLAGTIPIATTEAFKRNLYAITGGEGVFLTKPAGYRRIEHEYPTRKRADYNPLNRKEYLLHVLGAF